MDVDGNQINQRDSLSWWFNKEPLRSFEMGQGEGARASEIFGTDKIIVAHETESFIAYENITRSAKGRANVFISRQGHVGEAAAFGDGFYTQLGKEGARNTGLTIRFQLHPDAKEGTDFVFESGAIIIKNKNAFVLIQENLDISITGYLKLLDLEEITEKDKGLIEKFNRKFNRIGVNSQEFEDAVEFVQNSFFIHEDLPQELHFDISSLEFSSFDELIQVYTKTRKIYYSEIVNSLVKRDTTNSLSKLILAIIEKGVIDFEIIRFGLTQSRWFEYPEFVQALLIKNNLKIDQLLITEVLPDNNWLEHPSFLHTLIDKNDAEIDLLIGQKIFTRTIDNLDSFGWADHPELIQKMIAHDNLEVDLFLIEHVLTNYDWTLHPELVYLLIDKNHPEIDKYIDDFILFRSYWQYSLQKTYVNYNWTIYNLRRNRLKMLEEELKQNSCKSYL